MKLTRGVRSVFVKKLGVALANKVSLADFNEVFLYLSRCDEVYKIVPYGMFENESNLGLLKNSDAGKVFEYWVENKTSNIGKSFNKGRKLVRLFKEIVTGHQDNLVFNLSVHEIFVSALTSLFVIYNDENLPFSFPHVDKEKFNKTLCYLRGYFAALFFIDMVNIDSDVEEIIDVFVNGECDTLIDDILEIALKRVEQDLG